MPSLPNPVYFIYKNKLLLAEARLFLRYIDCFSVSQIKYAQNYIYERKKYGHEENVKKS